MFADLKVAAVLLVMMRFNGNGRKGELLSVKVVL